MRLFAICEADNPQKNARGDASPLDSSYFDPNQNPLIPLRNLANFWVGAVVAGWVLGELEQEVSALMGVVNPFSVPLLPIPATTPPLDCGAGLEFASPELDPP